ncbi:MAG: thymidine kinase [Fimbriimonadales bacterium]|nr:thymidine kinase [Fimbriimonadales bacterium]
MKSRRGQITVITGSMFAGKSEELIRLVRRAMFAKQRVQVFKHRLDARYERTLIATHMGVTHEATPVDSTGELRQLIDVGSDVVAVEEAQFFDHQLPDLSMELADKGMHVILAGLDQDFRREPFGSMARLMAIADEVVKLRAICMVCGSAASHTQRIIEGKPAAWGDPLILIGATETYEARCRKCYRITGVPRRR